MGSERAFDRQRVRPLCLFFARVPRDLSVRVAFTGRHQFREGLEQRPGQRRRLQPFAEAELPHGERDRLAGVGVAHRHVAVREQDREFVEPIHQAACPSM